MSPLSREFLWCDLFFFGRIVNGNCGDGRPDTQFVNKTVENIVTTNKFKNFIENASL